MNILFTALAFAAAQAAPASTDHSQHNAAQHAQHQQGQQQQVQHAQHKGEHKCCKEVNGKMECQMMKGHGTEKGQGQHQGHSGH